jgi:hypothetical protein
LHQEIYTFYIPYCGHIALLSLKGSAIDFLMESKLKQSFHLPGNPQLTMETPSCLSIDGHSGEKQMNSDGMSHFLCRDISDDMVITWTFTLTLCSSRLSAGYTRHKASGRD